MDVDTRRGWPDGEVTEKRLKKLLEDAEKVTFDSHHPCHVPKRSTTAPWTRLFPPINQRDRCRPLEPPSPHSTSRLARQVDTRPRPPPVVYVDEVAPSAGWDQAATEPALVVAW